MHTIYVILGVIANIICFLSIVAIVAGLVWTISPPKDKHYLGSFDFYVYYYPFGGRLTGICIIGSGIVGLVLGLIIDREQSKLMVKYGSRT